MLAWLVLLIACGGPSGPSVADLEAAKAEVHAFQPWGEAEAALKAKLGEPSGTADDVYTWAAHDGARCQILSVQKVGESVGSVEAKKGACP